MPARIFAVLFLVAFCACGQKMKIGTPVAVGSQGNGAGYGGGEAERPQLDAALASIARTLIAIPETDESLSCNPDTAPAICPPLTDLLNPANASRKQALFSFLRKLRGPLGQLLARPSEGLFIITDEDLRAEFQPGTFTQVDGLAVVGSGGERQVRLRRAIFTRLSHAQLVAFLTHEALHLVPHPAPMPAYPEDYSPADGFASYRDLWDTFGAMLANASTLKLSSVTVASAESSGSTIVSRGSFGKLIPQTPLTCVATRSAPWGLPNANWRPLGAAFGGKEILYVAQGNHLKLEVSGNLTVYRRGAVYVGVEVLGPGGTQVHADSIPAVGNVWETTITEPIAAVYELNGIVPGAGYRIRAHLGTYTPDDGACPATSPGSIEVSEMSLRMEDSAR